MSILLVIGFSVGIFLFAIATLDYIGIFDKYKNRIIVNYTNELNSIIEKTIHEHENLIPKFNNRPDITSSNEYKKEMKKYITIINYLVSINITKELYIKLAYTYGISGTNEFINNRVFQLATKRVLTENNLL